MTNLYDSEDFTGSVEFGATWPRDAALGDWGGDLTPGDCGGDLTVGWGLAEQLSSLTPPTGPENCLRKEKRIFVKPLSHIHEFSYGRSRFWNF